MVAWKNEMSFFLLFSIVWSQDKAPLVTSLPSSCYMYMTHHRVWISNRDVYFSHAVEERIFYKKFSVFNQTEIFEWLKFLRRHLHPIQGNWAGRNFITASRVNSRLITRARMQRWIWNLQLRPDLSVKKKSWIFSCLWRGGEKSLLFSAFPLVHNLLNKTSQFYTTQFMTNFHEIRWFHSMIRVC